MPTNPDVIRPMHIGLRDTFVLSAVSTSLSIPLQMP
jgi:hypothetical protein